MNGASEKAEAERREAALRILREAGKSETVGMSALSREAENPHPDAVDPVEIWGKRVGRTLGAIAFLALAAYLLAEYGPR